MKNVRRNLSKVLAVHNILWFARRATLLAAMLKEWVFEG
jgi:hypothetical protein